MIEFALGFLGGFGFCLGVLISFVAWRVFRNTKR